MKVRTVDELMADFAEKAVGISPAHLELVKSFLIAARVEIILMKAEQLVKQQQNESL